MIMMDAALCPEPWDGSAEFKRSKYGGFCKEFFYLDNQHVLLRLQTATKGLLSLFVLGLKSGFIHSNFSLEMSYSMLNKSFFSREIVILEAFRPISLFEVWRTL